MRSLWRSQSHWEAHAVLCCAAVVVLPGEEQARKSWAVMSRFSMLRHGRPTDESLVSDMETLVLSAVWNFSDVHKRR